MTAPLAAYNCDEASGAVLDISGNGHDFTLSGTSVRTADGGGRHGKGLTQSDTTIDAGPALFGMTAERTLMLDLKTTAGFTGWIWEYHDNTNDTGRWGMLCLDGNLGFRGTNISGATGHARIARPTDDAWHNWAGTYDGAAVRLYLDGVLADTRALPDGLINDADVLRLFTSAGSAQVIDNIRVFGAALSGAQVAALAGTPVVPPSASRWERGDGVDLAPFLLTAGGLVALE